MSIKYCSDNKNCLTPSFVSAALAGITHRFVLVLECETRTDPSDARANNRVPPRFAIGGPRATIDPRTAKIVDLLPLAKHKLELPPGWEKVHQYMYVLQPGTDEHGWQYRSEWSDGPLSDTDELWVKFNSHGLDARRRLWITTVVREEDQVSAKQKLSKAFTDKPRGVIILGDLFRQEQRTLRKVWVKRFVVLTDTKIEVFVNSGGKKIADLPLQDCDIKMLFGVQCPGRDFAFSIRDAQGQLVALFDAENREIRRRWVVAIRYQLAIHCAGMNFPPFDYGPPTGDEPNTRVLMCGELQKQGHSVKNWKNRFFQLTPAELQYFDKEELRGALQLVGAKLIENEKAGPLDFSIETEAGKLLVMRADTLSHKTTWLRAIQRQIALQNEKRRGGDSTAAPAPLPAAPVQSAPAPAPAPEPEETQEEVVEDEHDAEQHPELEVAAETREMIRRYTIDQAPEILAPAPNPEAGWEEAGIDDTPENAEGRSSMIMSTNRSSIIRGTGAAATLDSLPEEEDEQPTEVYAAVFQGLSTNESLPVSNNEEAPLSEAEQLPEPVYEPTSKQADPEPEAEEDKEEVYIEQTPVDMLPQEPIYQTVYEPIPEPEPERVVAAAPAPVAAAPSAKATSAPKADISKSATLGLDFSVPSTTKASSGPRTGPLANIGRPLAKRQVEIKPDSLVGGQVLNIEQRRRGAPRFI